MHVPGPVWVKMGNYLNFCCMPAASPQTTAQDLFARIEVLFGTDSPPNAFTKRQLLREADSLMKVDAAEGSSVKAAIAAFSWDLPEAKRWIGNALALSSSVNTRINAALNYKNLNQLLLASTISQETYKLAPLDGEVVNRALSYLTWSGQLEEAVPVHAHAAKNGLLKSEDNIDPALYLACMNRIGVPQARLQFELAAAYDVLTRNQKRVRFLVSAIEVDPESGAESLLFGLGFWGGLEDEMRMESQLAQIFADEPGWNPSALSVELQYEQLANANEFA